MINEMVQKVHPGLHGPLMGLTTMMMAVQEQLPNLLQGKPVTEPSTLVHEMFVRYANGTKTDADLSQISKGLDEIFTHEYTADDAAKAIDLVNAKDLFADAGPKPQLFPNTTIPFQAPPVKAWPNMNATMGLKPNTYTPTNLTFVAGKKDQAIKAKYNDTLAGVTQWRIQQAAWDNVRGGGRRAGEAWQTGRQAHAPGVPTYPSHQLWPQKHPIAAAAEQQQPPQQRSGRAHCSPAAPMRERNIPALPPHHPSSHPPGSRRARKCMPPWKA